MLFRSDVGETSQVPSSRVVSSNELLVLVGGENVLVRYFEIGLEGFVGFFCF